MDVNFLNAYTEVLNENLDAVLKQNFLLQTRLKISEKNSALNEKQELEKKLSALIRENEEFRNALIEKEREVNSLVPFKDKNLQFDNILNEKNRIQESLNQSLQKISSLESSLKSSQQLVIEKNEENKKLEEQVSSLKDEVQKLKPISISEVLEVKPKKTKMVDSPKIEQGGTF